MDQAQGAILAARAAGAEQYGPTEFAAAVEALRRAEEAVAQNDHRLALSLAIDSRTQAQNAAKAAVEARAKARGDAERAVAEVATLVAHARERLKDPTVASLPRGRLQAPRMTIDQADKSMQKARAALNAHEYARAVQLSEGLATRLQAALATIDDRAAANRSPRRR